jgi:hypothetical protein
VVHLRPSTPGLRHPGAPARPVRPAPTTPTAPRPTLTPAPRALEPAPTPALPPTRQDRAAEQAEHQQQLVAAQQRQAPQLVLGLERALAALSTARPTEQVSGVDRLVARLAAAEQGLAGTPHAGEARASVAAALPALRTTLGPEPGSKLDKALARLAAAAGSPLTTTPSTNGAPVLVSASGLPAAKLGDSELGLGRVEIEALASKLTARGTPFALIEVPLGNGLSAPAIQLLAGPKGLGRVAARVAEQYGAELVYCPAYNHQQDAHGVFNPTQNRVYLDGRTLEDDKLSAVGRHEVRHAHFHAQRKAGKSTSLYNAEFHSTAVSGLSRRSSIYRNYQSAEELSTWGKNVRDSFEARTGKVDRWELKSRVSGLQEIAQQTQDVAARKLKLVDELLATQNSKALRDATESIPVKSYDGGVSIRYLAYTTKIALVGPEHGKLLEALKSAEAKFEKLDRTFLPGVLKPKAWREAKAELDTAQRAVLTAARTQLTGLQTLGEKYESGAKELGALLSRLSAAETLRYTAAGDRPAKLEALAQDPVFAKVLEGLRGRELTGDEAWRSLSDACARAAQDALAKQGLVHASRLANLAHGRT